MSLSIARYGGLSTASKVETVKNKETEASAKSVQKTAEGGLEETITALAKKDVENRVYMDEEYFEIEREEVAKVSPDRKTAIAQATKYLSGKKGCTVADDIEYYLSLLFHLPQKETKTEAVGTAEIRDEKGELIATYSSTDGLWYDEPTVAENTRDSEIISMYHDAYCNARDAMKTNAATGTLLDRKA